MKMWENRRKSQCVVELGLSRITDSWVKSVINSWVCPGREKGKYLIKL